VNNASNREFKDIVIKDSVGGYWNPMEYFTTYKIIPLETNEKSIIGKIQNISINDNKIILLDKQRIRIHVFEITGNHLYTINKIGLGPGELMEPFDFYIDQMDTSIMIYDRLNGLIKYNLSGEFIQQSKTIFHNPDFNVIRIQNIKENYFLFRKSVPGGGSPNFTHGYKLYLGDYQKLQDSFLSYTDANFTNTNLSYTNVFSKFENGFNYWEVFRDTLYYIDFVNRSLKRKYYFDFQERSMSDIASKMPLEQLLTYLNSSGDKYSGMVNNVIEFQDFILFNYSYNLNNDLAKLVFAKYDKTTETTTSYNGIGLDEIKIRINSLQFKLSENSAYAVVSPVELYNNSYNDEFIDANSILESDNPLLVIFSR